MLLSRLVLRVDVEFDSIYSRSLPFFLLCTSVCAFKVCVGGGGVGRERSIYILCLSGMLRQMGCEGSLQLKTEKWMAEIKHFSVHITACYEQLHY